MVRLDGRSWRLNISRSVERRVSDSTKASFIPTSCQHNTKSSDWASVMAMRGRGHTGWLDGGDDLGQVDVG